MKKIRKNLNKIMNGLYERKRKPDYYKRSFYKLSVKLFILMGFKKAFTYLLDVLCYGYYTESNNLISDNLFDELEKLYCNIFKEETAPMRGIERKECYSNGVKMVYEYITKPELYCEDN